MDFARACRFGKIEIAKEIFKKGNIDIHAYNEFAFRWTCEHGHLEVAKWLLNISLNNTKLGIINIHAEDEDAFRLACRNGYFK